jgi:cysteinyl-tRNA synthetase
LKEKLKERGLPVSGLKSILIKRLKDSQQGSSNGKEEIEKTPKASKSVSSPPLSVNTKQDPKKKVISTQTQTQTPHVSAAALDVDDLESLMIEGEKLLQAPQTPDRATKQQHGKPGGGGGFEFDADKVQALVDERHQFRMVRDFESADAIVDQLRQDYGVEIQSSRGVWIARDGSKGPLSPDGFSSSGSGTGSDRLSGSPSIPLKILASNENCRLTKAQIQKLVDERTQNRRKRFFNEADKIRDTLASEGVELLDGEDIWRTTNGALQGSQSNIDKSRWRDR